MTVRPELEQWYRQVHDDLADLGRALDHPRSRERVVLIGRRVLAGLGQAAPGPRREEQTIARLQAAVAELVTAARDGDDDELRFALRWVTESIRALGISDDDADER